MQTVAEQLRKAREQRKLTVYDVAGVTKIRTDHVRALEEGNYLVFAAPVYVRGFVRSYGNLLKLDVPVLMAALEAELSEIKEFKEPSRLGGKRESILDSFMLGVSKVNWQLVVVVLGAGLILTAGIWGYRSWHERQTKDPLADLGPGAFQSNETNAGEVLPLPRP